MNFSKNIYRGPVVAELEAGTDLQVLLGLPQLVVGGGGVAGETAGRLSAGDGEHHHHQDQEEAQHGHADYHDLRHRGWNYYTISC